MPLRRGAGAKVNYSSTQLCGCVLPDGPHGPAPVVLRVHLWRASQCNRQKHITLPSVISMTKITILNIELFHLLKYACGELIYANKFRGKIRGNLDVDVTLTPIQMRSALFFQRQWLQRFSGRRARR